MKALFYLGFPFRLAFAGIILLFGAFMFPKDMKEIRRDCGLLIWGELR